MINFQLTTGKLLYKRSQSSYTNMLKLEGLYYRESIKGKGFDIAGLFERGKRCEVLKGVFY